jgi:hypothetical protein
LGYDRRMRAFYTGSLLLFLSVGSCSAQAQPPSGGAPAYVEISLPAGVRSETLFVRYVLDDDFGGWLEPHPGVSSYFIGAIHEGTTAKRFRAVVYAPGCMLKTIDLAILGTAIPRYTFVCQPLSNVTLTGTLVKPDRFQGKEVNVEMNYVARWAQGFLGFGDGIITKIPLGATPHVSANGSFVLSVPAFAEDPLARTPDHAGEIEFWARDTTGEKIVAQIIPTAHSLRTRMGGLQIRKEYPEPVEFAPCSGPHQDLQPHDSFGFVLRPEPKHPIDACDD